MTNTSNRWTTATEAPESAVCPAGPRLAAMLTGTAWPASFPFLITFSSTHVPSMDFLLPLLLVLE